MADGLLAQRHEQAMRAHITAGIGLLQTLHERIHLRASLLKSHAVFEACNDLQVVVAAVPLGRFSRQC